jgi:non-ribosomal peptide synthetase component E (peptide arylation enzyme)
LAASSDGLLIISGCQEDKLNIGGGKIAAEKIEALLSTFPAIADGAVFDVINARGAEEVWAAIVWRGAADVENLRAHC